MTHSSLLFNHYRYCPACGAPLRREHAYPQEPEYLFCIACGGTLYPDPKVVACVVVDINGKILLVRRKRHDDVNKWLLPGGYVNAGEKIEHAAQREIREETNLDICVDGLVGVFSYTDSPIVIIVYHSFLNGAEPSPNNEIKTLALFAPHELPWNELAYLSTRDALRAYLHGQLWLTSSLENKVLKDSFTP